MQSNPNSSQDVPYFLVDGTEARKLPQRVYMMATVATHRLGPISSLEPDLCYVYAEDDNDYVGRWVCGTGFFDVRFPKATTRPLTDEEFDFYSRTELEMNGRNYGMALPVQADSAGYGYVPGCR